MKKLIYDDSCSLCRFCANLVKSRAGEELVLEAALFELKEPKYIDSNGVEYIGSSAVSALCRDFPRVLEIVSFIPESFKQGFIQAGYQAAKTIKSACIPCRKKALN